MRKFHSHFLSNTKLYDLPIIYKYILSTFLVLFVLILHFSFQEFFGSARFFLIYPVVFLSAWILGTGPGILTVVISSGTALFFLTPHPVNAPFVTIEDALRIFGFIFNLLFMIWLINKGHTDKKKLLESQKILHEALFYRDEFLSIASHELKTPLTSLKLQSQMFKRAIAKKDPTIYSPDKIDRLIDQTDRQVSRLMRLVDDMLDISRIRTGKLSITPEVVNVSEMVKEAYDRMRPMFAESLTELPQIHVEENILAKCDRMRIEQVVSNLISNALKYGERKPFIIKVENKHPQVKISIIDQGMGIAPENHEKIFNRFQRAVPASEVSGLGLGLYIGRLLVEAHQGTLTLKSELGKGSVFTIALPGFTEQV